MSRLLLVLLLLASAAFGAEPVALAVNGDFARGTEDWNIRNAELALVDSGLPEYPRALRLTVDPPEGAPGYHSALTQTIRDGIGQGDRLRLRFWARSPESAQVMAYLETNKEPYDKSISEMITLGPEWKLYELTGASLHNYNLDQASFGWHLAHGKGTIEITGVDLVDLDRDVSQRPTAENPIALITNGDFSAGTDAWFGHGPYEARVVDADAPGHAKALRLSLHPAEGASSYTIGYGQILDQPIGSGDAIYFRAWMRSPQSLSVAFVHELNEAPHTKTFRHQVKLTPEWKEYRFMGRSPRSYQPGESVAKWHLGFGQGEVDIAGVTIENYGRAEGMTFDQTIDWWGGRDHNDDWRAAAEQRIEQHRKGDVAIRVVDAAGNPVPNARVEVDQQRHAFRWGTAAPASRFLDTTNPDNARFRDAVEKWFNTVTFENDLKWAAGSPDRLEQVERAIEWLHERDIEVRGHVLVWGSYKHLHPSLRELRGEALLNAIHEHVDEYAKRMDGKLYLWDVVNEAGSNTEVWDEVGWEHFADTFRRARAADPDVLLAYNDYGILHDNSPDYRAKVKERIEYLFEHDAPVDVLGLQGHIGTPLTPISRVLETLDEWAAWGKPLEITEYDLGLPDDARHADYTRDFMTAAFSHPSVQAFIMWGFWEGSHWRAKDQGHMVNRDWTNRPAMDTWLDLVFNEWWTDETLTTAADGTASARAFYGTHTVTAEANGRRGEASLALAPGEDGTVTITLR